MSKPSDTQLDLYDEFFGDAKFGTVTLDDIGTVQTPDDPEQWTYVRARTGGRDTLLYSEGIYVVRRTRSDRSLVERLEQQGHTDKIADGRVKASVDDVEQAMPSFARASMAVPSLRGEYLDVRDVRAREQDDGTIRVETGAGFSDTIPVEYVIETLTYDEVVCELLDAELS